MILHKITRTNIKLEFRLFSVCFFLSKKSKSPEIEIEMKRKKRMHTHEETALN